MDINDFKIPEKKILEDVTDGIRIFHFSMDQNTDLWDAIRIGRVTASNASVLLTQAETKTGKPVTGSWNSLSKGAVTYANKLARERYDPNTAKDPDTYYGADMQRGHEQEGAAAKAFEIRTGLQTMECGFISIGDHIGCSPDRLIKGFPVGLEMKAANKSIQWDRLKDPESFKNEHEAQCQFNMWVSGYKAWGLTSWCPLYTKEEDRLLLLRINRDEEIMRRLSDQYMVLEQLIKEILDTKKTPVINPFNIIRNEPQVYS